MNLIITILCFICSAMWFGLVVKASVTDEVNDMEKITAECVACIAMLVWGLYRIC